MFGFLGGEKGGFAEAQQSKQSILMITCKIVTYKLEPSLPFPSLNPYVPDKVSE